MSTGPNPVPFNSLGQILSQGGEQALAKAIFLGFSEERIVALFLRRFEPMTPDDREALRAFSDEIVVAGVVVAGVVPPGQITAGMIPVNEFLYGDSAEGRRVRVAFDVEVEGLTRLISVVEDFPDIPTIDELREAARSKIFSIAEKYPELFGLQPGETPNIINLIIPFTERKF